MNSKTDFMIDLDGLLAKLEPYRNKDYSRIVVAGAGTHTRLIWDVLLSVFKKIDVVLDQNSIKESFLGVPLLKRSLFKPQGNDLIIISSHAFEGEIYLELRSEYGCDVPILRLYDKDSFSGFMRELKSIDIGWENYFDELNFILNDQGKNAIINAASIGILLANMFSLERIAAHALPLSDETSMAHKSKTVQFLKDQFREILPLNGLGNVVVVDLYNAGNHTIYSILDVAMHLVQQKIVDNVIILHTEAFEIDLANDWGKENLYLIDLSLGVEIKSKLPEPDSEYKLALESIDSDAFPLISSVVKQYQNKLSYNVAEALLYAEMLNWLFDQVNCKLFLNLQDNRLLSRAFHLSEFSAQIPVVQIQHGILSSALCPLWANLYIGWKDMHSKRTYGEIAPDKNSFLPVGNLYLNSLAKQIQEHPIPLKRTGKKIFLYLYQGPAYWHGDHQAILNALEIIRDAISDLPEDWQICIKMRNRSGNGFLSDFFGSMYDNAVQIIPFNQELKNVLAEVDAVGVLSSSGRDEADFFGLPTFVLEKDDSTSIISFGKEGMAVRVSSGSDLVTALEHCKRRNSDNDLLQVKNPSLAASREDWDLMMSRIRSLIN